MTGAEVRSGGGVVAQFSDGSSAHGDVLVGADGVHSAIRSLVDPANPARRYTGLGNTGGFAHVPGLDSNPGDYAVVLAKCLRDTGSVSVALANYEQLCRRRVERIVRWGSGMNNTKKSGLTGWILRELALPLLLRKAADPKEVDKMAWMFHHHIDWEAPVRPV